MVVLMWRVLVFAWLLIGVFGYDGSVLQAQINAAIEKGVPNYEIPSGEYIFNMSNFVIIQASNMAITGTNVSLIFYPGFGVTIGNSSKVTLEGITIDYDPPCFSQGVISAVDTATQELTITIDEGFPLPDPALSPYFSLTTEVKVIYWEPSTKNIVYGQQQSNPWNSTKRIGENTYVIGLQLMKFVPKVGYLVTIGPRIGGTPQPLPTFYHGSYMILNSTQVVTQNITILGSGTFAILEWSGFGGHVYSGITLTRKLSPFHLLSSNMDAFHSFSVGHGPLVENCEFAFMGDDFFNIHNRVFVVLPPFNNPKTLTVLDVGDILGLNYEPMYTMPSVVEGDEFTFYAINSTRYIGAGNVVRTTRITDQNIINNASNVLSILNSPPFNARILAFVPSLIQVWEVEFESLPAIEPYCLVQYNAKSGIGALVRNNYFHDSYDNSMRLQSSYTVVENNVFERAEGGINVVFDQAWLEGSLGLHSISILNNTFISVPGCNSTNSCVLQIGPGIYNLTIEGNVVQK